MVWIRRCPKGLGSSWHSFLITSGSSQPKKETSHLLPSHSSPSPIPSECHSQKNILHKSLAWKGCRNGRHSYCSRTKSGASPLPSPACSLGSEARAKQGYGWIPECLDCWKAQLNCLQRKPGGGEKLKFPWLMYSREDLGHHQGGRMHAISFFSFCCIFTLKPTFPIQIIFIHKCLYIFLWKNKLTTVCLPIWESASWEGWRYGGAAPVVTSLLESLSKNICM